MFIFSFSYLIYLPEKHFLFVCFVFISLNKPFSKMLIRRDVGET